MLFNSLKFALFFPCVTAGYFVLPHRLRNLWLLGCSYLFYMCWNPRYALLMLASTAVTWAAGMAMKNAGKARKKRVLALAVALNLAILFLFKYAGFVLDNINAVRHALGLQSVFTGFQLLLPVGISFYIFQAVGYAADVYRGEVEPETSFLRYALFVSFFPQLVAGPIERSRNMLPQFREVHHFDYQRFRSGLVQMLWGYIQKLVIADRLALLVDGVYANLAQQGTVSLLFAAVFFAVQLYCDFSSYSDIAIGAARIMGFDLMRNFNSPYLSLSLGEFWNRWHISLSTWLRDNVYIPLGGNRKGTLRTCLNLLAVFLVSGIWHGAAWTYVVWGGLHGLWMAASRLSQNLRTSVCKALHIDRQGKLHRFLCWLLTFVFVSGALVIFRADSLSQAMQFYRGLLHWSAMPFVGGFEALGMDRADFVVSCLAVAALFVCDWLRCKKGPLTPQLLAKPVALQWAVLLAGILLVVVFGMYGEGYVEKPFIYFQF